MKQKNVETNKNTTIYICNWTYGYINQSWTWEEFGCQVLDTDYYQHFLNDQNVTTQDTEVFHWGDGDKRVNTRRFTFMRHLKGDEYACLDIRNLKMQWEQDKKNAPIKEDVIRYWERDDFRNGPALKTNRRRMKSKQAIRHSRRIKHHPYLKSLAYRYDEDMRVCRKTRERFSDIYGDCDFYGGGKISRSWKDQTRKKKQWM